MNKTRNFGLIIAIALFSLHLSAQKIVIMRHGEKPSEGLGQLSCQGLNRSLALPKVLSAKFGKPDHIFAPNPGVRIHDRGGSYNYIRPLATIEPTAISLGMPVNTDFGFSSTDELAAELVKAEHASEVIFVAWEHLKAVELMKKIVSLLGSNVSVPHWSDSDFDSIFVLDIDPNKSAPVILIHDKEGLDGLSKACPTVQAP